MVQKKLVGVFSTPAVEIPFEAYDLFLDIVMEYLDDYGIDMQKSDVAELPGIIESFEAGAKEILGEISWGEMQDYVDIDSVVQATFTTEIAVIAAAEEEKRQIAQEARITQAKLDDANRKEAALLKATEETSISIKNKHLKKAMALLVAAGFLKA